MAKNLISRIAILILVFSLFFVASILLYTGVADRYIDNKSSVTLKSLNDQTASEVNFRLANDYHNLNILITANPDIDSLNAKETKLYEVPVLAFGRLANNTYSFGGNSYLVGNEVVEPSYLLRNIVFYNVDKDFSATITNQNTAIKSKNIIIFKVEDVVAYVDADLYFESIVANAKSAIDNKLFLIEDNGRICYQSDSANQFQFYNMLREENSSSTIDNLRENIYNYNEEKVICYNIKMNDVSHYVLYSAINKDLTNNVYIVSMYEDEIVNDLMSGILLPLLLLLLLYAIILSFGVFILYLAIVRKNEEIQLAKLTYHRHNIYIVRISKKGKIRRRNLVVKKEFPNLKTVYDFALADNDEDIQTLIDGQKAFTVENVVDDTISYIQFIPIQTRTARFLVGNNITDVRDRFMNYRLKALYSPLTNMPNGQVLAIEIDRIVEKNRSEKVKKGYLLCLGIMRFENYNTLFNSKMCDLVVQKVGEVLKTYEIEYNAKAYHLDNDNFAVIFEEATDTTSIKAFCDVVHEFFKRPLEVEGNMLDIEIKFGSVSISDEDNTINGERIIENGKLILNKVKSTSGMYYGEYDVGLNKFLTKERVMFEDLKKAIANKEFEMYLQAQYDNNEERIVGFESLIRWNNPKYKFQSPGHYIQIAEQNNMINKMGDIVIEKTFEIAKKLEKYDVTVSLNVSPIQIMQSGFVNSLLDLTKEYKISPQKIAIEITETFLMENFQLVIDKMKLLKEKGFYMHLDDFGTGWSSMLYLKELPFDTIKIDKDFIKFVGSDKYTRVIVSKIISIAKNLDLDVIAEGVETEADNQFLYKNGCNVIQGYLISKPVPFDEALALLEDYNSGKIKIKKTKKNND